jgi:hypothetical protein
VSLSINRGKIIMKALKPEHFTMNLHLDAGAYILDVNVDPKENLDDTFKAWCNDEQEMLEIDGWTVAILEEQDQWT